MARKVLIRVGGTSWKKSSVQFSQLEAVTVPQNGLPSAALLHSGEIRNTAALWVVPEREMGTSRAPCKNFPWGPGGTGVHEVNGTLTVKRLHRNTCGP